MCSEGVYYWILNLLKVTHLVDEGCYLLMDIQTKLFGLAGVLPIVNLHKVLGFTQAKKYYILYRNELVGFRKLCSNSCRYAHNLETFMWGIRWYG